MKFQRDSCIAIEDFRLVTFERNLIDDSKQIDDMVSQISRLEPLSNDQVEMLKEFKDRRQQMKDLLVSIRNDTGQNALDVKNIEFLYFSLPNALSNVNSLLLEPYETVLKPKVQLMLDNIENRGDLQDFYQDVLKSIDKRLSENTQKSEPLDLEQRLERIEKRSGPWQNVVKILYKQSSNEFKVYKMHIGSQNLDVGLVTLTLHWIRMDFRYSLII